MSKYMELLDQGINLKLGIPNETFALCFSGVAETVAQFELLPFSVLLATLCPPGSEGALTSFLALALCLSSIISGFLGIVLNLILGFLSSVASYDGGDDVLHLPCDICLFGPYHLLLFSGSLSALGLLGGCFGYEVTPWGASMFALHMQLLYLTLFTLFRSYHYLHILVSNNIPLIPPLISIIMLIIIILYLIQSILECKCNTDLINAIQTRHPNWITQWKALFTRDMAIQKGLFGKGQTLFLVIVGAQVGLYWHYWVLWGDKFAMSYLPLFLFKCATRTLNWAPAFNALTDVCTALMGNILYAYPESDFTKDTVASLGFGGEKFSHLAFWYGIACWVINLFPMFANRPTGAAREETEESEQLSRAQRRRRNRRNREALASLIRKFSS
ncbi:Biopterin transporter family [Dillenia turbinata]|uniref:Biopterin transporter family n=1 Tax=Dillenia turbinata TaxID=194707 RepID=A0AAN8VXV4_9MAGN